MKVRYRKGHASYAVSYGYAHSEPLRPNPGRAASRSGLAVPKPHQQKCMARLVGLKATGLKPVSGREGRTRPSGAACTATMSPGTLPAYM